MTAELITSVAGSVLSLLFSYIPGLNDWFNKLEGTPKRLIMLAMLLLVSGGAFGLGCAGWFGVEVSCDQAGIEKMISAFILALMANQSTYAISPKLERFQ